MHLKPVSMSGEYHIDEATVASTISITTLMSAVTLIGWSQRNRGARKDSQLTAQSLRISVCLRLRRKRASDLPSGGGQSASFAHWLFALS